jgi:hypothetical protein
MCCCNAYYEILKVQHVSIGKASIIWQARLSFYMDTAGPEFSLFYARNRCHNYCQETTAVTHATHCHGKITVHTNRCMQTLLRLNVAQGPCIPLYACLHNLHNAYCLHDRPVAASHTGILPACNMPNRHACTHPPTSLKAFQERCTPCNVHN